MKDIDFAIIGGTGAFKRVNFKEKIYVTTQYGKIPLEIIELNGIKVALLKRHGSNHSIPPHKINYRANMMALKTLGVKKVLATAAVGSLNTKFKPGNLVLLTDFIDFTWGRDSTFFEGGEKEVIHVDMTNPYCLDLRKKLYEAAGNSGISVQNYNAVYVCTQGPRFETPAEIKMYEQIGGDLVGMTSVPEVVLAREAELCYATVAIVTNFAAGITKDPLTHQEVLEVMKSSSEELETLMIRTIATLDNKICSCQKAASQESLGG